MAQANLSRFFVPAEFGVAIGPAVVHISTVLILMVDIRTMHQPLPQVLSQYSRDAAVLLGQLIRTARIERRLTTAGLAERAGISRGLVQRIERGDPACAIGRVFECAAIVGVRLFDLDRAALAGAVESARRTLTLMPKSVRAARDEADDDF